MSVLPLLVRLSLYGFVLEFFYTRTDYRARALVNGLFGRVGATVNSDLPNARVPRKQLR